MAARRAPDQPDLLDWTPPQPVRRFDDHRVRAVSQRDRLARAVAASLKDCDDAGVTREDIASRMGEFLGERVSVNMLNAYASPARDDHTISVTRLMALLHATRDQRLLELLAEPLGWAVVDRKFLPLIELAATREKIDELEKRVRASRALARKGGAL